MGSRCFVVGRWVLLMLLPLTAATRSCEPPIKPKKVIVIMTDDQRWDTMWAMPLTLDRLANHGVVFENAFVTTPICSPTRASFLSGGFTAGETGLLTNRPPNGGSSSFHDANNLGVLLQRQGWKTALVGKYMNGYANGAPYIPPGWDLFFSSVNGSFAAAPEADYVVGSTEHDAPGEGTFGNLTQFRTDEYRDQVLQFLDAHPGDNVFVLYVDQAPHAPATPAPGDENLFADYEFRGGAWCEEDASDKPFPAAPCTQEGIDQQDEFHRNQLRSLQAVDRAVGDIYDHVSDEGWLDMTTFVFTSDNGMPWGEHRFFTKGVPYEESIRVPLIVVHPEVQPSTEDKLALINLDVPAMVLGQAGLEPLGDSADLMPLLRFGDAVPWRDRAYFEFWNDSCVWTAVRTESHKWIERCDGSGELYDLLADPIEELNVAGDPTYAQVQTELASDLSTQRRLAITYFGDTAPAAYVGEPYSLTIPTWGEQGPVAWDVVAGELPPGLTLDNGVISGVPEDVGTDIVYVYNPQILVSDAAPMPYTGEPRQEIRELTFLVVDVP